MSEGLVRAKSRAHFGFVLLLNATLLFAACSKSDLPVASRSPIRSSDTRADQRSELVDLNSASKTQLISLPGIGEAHAQQIIEGRPYRDKRELVRKNIISEKTYELLSEKVIAKQD